MKLRVVASTMVIALACFVNPSKSVAQDKPLKQIYQETYQRALRFNDRAEAKSALYHLIALEPKNDSLMTTLAYIYFEARQYASTVLICMDALTINPDNFGALEMSAVSYENLGINEKALDNYEKLYLITDDYQSLYKMAFLQYDLEKYRQALTNIDILLTKKETDEVKMVFTIEEEDKEFAARISLLNLKGLVHKELGNLDQARQNYEQALALAPEFIFAQQNIADLDK